MRQNCRLIQATLGSRPSQYPKKPECPLGRHPLVFQICGASGAQLRGIGSAGLLRVWRKGGTRAKIRHFYTALAQESNRRLSIRTFQVKRTEEGGRRIASLSPFRQLQGDVFTEDWRKENKPPAVVPVRLALVDLAG